MGLRVLGLGFRVRVLGSRFKFCLAECYQLSVFGLSPYKGCLKFGAQGVASEFQCATVLQVLNYEASEASGENIY